MEVAADTFLLIQKRVLCATLEQRKKRKNKKEPTQRQGRGKRAFPSIYSRSVQLLLHCPQSGSRSRGAERQLPVQRGITYIQMNSLSEDWPFSFSCPLHLISTHLFKHTVSCFSLLLSFFLHSYFYALPSCTPGSFFAFSPVCLESYSSSLLQAARALAC